MMRFRPITILLASLFMLSGCRQDNEPMPGGEDDNNYTYSFTAVLNGLGTRMSYEEDPESHNLKMKWDEADVIWLYPDESMNDPVERYEFVPNTGAGTSHTVFVHQGFIKNWEHWSGKAIYLFENGDNLEVEVNSEEFVAKSRVQKSNNNTEHLKYAEHKLDDEGKHYTEYWANILHDANLKHDHKLTFNHLNTVVYKVMLRGFIFDIPGGSQLKMSGDAWNEETVLTLGSKDDKEPFLKVGEYGKEGYEDKVLTAYFIRQIPGNVRGIDGQIEPGGEIKFDLLCYDKDDGTVMPLHELDKPELFPHRRTPEDPTGEKYLTNVPWGEEYTWTVKATSRKEYLAGDYVVADFTDTTKEYAYPKIAVDLGLPLKWSAYNLGAKKVDEYGAHYIHGYTNPFVSDTKDLIPVEWLPGDKTYDPAAVGWGDGWQTPSYLQFFDLIQYTDWIDDTGASSTIRQTDGGWYNTLDVGNRYREYSPGRNPFYTINDVPLICIKSKVNGKYIYMPAAGYVRESSLRVFGEELYYMTSDLYNDLTVTFVTFLDGHGPYKHYSLSYTGEQKGSLQKYRCAWSLRPTKARK